MREGGAPLRSHWEPEEGEHSLPLIPIPTCAAQTPEGRDSGRSKALQRHLGKEGGVSYTEAEKARDVN